MSKKYTVKQVAAFSGLSVRALHHYDSIHLLEPEYRTVAGYRLYSDKTLLRLQQIVIGQSLGLSLEHIRRLLDEPDFDPRNALLTQRKQLQERLDSTVQMLRSLDTALENLEFGQKPLDPESLFVGFNHKFYKQEAKKRWGRTDAWSESARRTKKYGKVQWTQITQEQAEIYRALARAMQFKHKPNSVHAMKAAESQRLSIDRWFYPCDHNMHQSLADCYEGDPRFAKNIDKYGCDLTPYFCAAIRANAVKQTS